jgi:hypothetical protein
VPLLLDRKGIPQMLRSLTVLLLAVALTLALAACEDDPKVTQKKEPAPDEPAPVVTILCDTETELITAAGYTLYEGTGCPTETIDAEDAVVAGDDGTDLYTLPWDFPFMGTNYTDIVPSMNGKIWLSSDIGLYYWEVRLSDGSQADGTAWLGTGVPFIAAWNLDLNPSTCLGLGNCTQLRLQALADPDRIVVNWNAEVIDDQTGTSVNDLTATLFSTGDILFFYNYFGTDDPDYNDLCAPGEETDVNGYCGDFGSGISNADGGTFIDLTNTIGHPVWTQTGKAFLFHPN